MPVTAHTVDQDRGRHEVRTIQVLPAPADLNFPHVTQVFLIERTVTVKGHTSCQAMLYVTSLTPDQADAVDLLAYVRRHWGVEVLHWTRDVIYREDASRIRAMATLRNVSVSLLRISGATNIAAALHNARKTTASSNTSSRKQAKHQPADFAVPVARSRRRKAEQKYALSRLLAA